MFQVLTAKGRGGLESWPLFGFSKIQKLTHHPRNYWSKWWTGGRCNGYIYIEGMKGTSLPFPFSAPLSLHTKVRQGGSRGGTLFSILNNESKAKKIFSWFKIVQNIRNRGYLKKSIKCLSWLFISMLLKDNLFQKSYSNLKVCWNFSPCLSLNICYR